MKRPSFSFHSIGIADGLRAVQVVQQADRFKTGPLRRTDSLNQFSSRFSNRFGPISLDLHPNGPQIEPAQSQFKTGVSTIDQEPFLAIRARTDQTKAESIHHMLNQSMKP